MPIDRDPKGPAGALRSGRRRLLGAFAASSATALAPWPAAHAQTDFPSRPIRIIVPYSTGTGSDALARTVATAITDKTGRRVVVENHEGAGSLIGTMAVAKAPPDGYTILIAANPMAILPSQSARPPYDPVQDFVPVAKVGVIPLVLAVSPTLKLGSVKDLVAYAKANPGKLNYGSSGPGTISQQEMELFKQAAGIDVVEVPYKSTSQAMTDLIGGTLQVFPVVVPLVAPHLQTGRTTALAVFDSARSPSLPDVPAITEEFNVRGYAPTPVWYGFVAPAKTPAAVVQALASMIGGAMETTEVRTRMTALGAQRSTVSNEQFAAEIRAEYEKAGALARRLGTAR